MSKKGVVVLNDCQFCCASFELLSMYPETMIHELFWRDLCDIMSYSPAKPPRIRSKDGMLACSAWVSEAPPIVQNHQTMALIRSRKRSRK